VQRGAFAGGKHHDCHDAFAVHPACRAATDPNVTGKLIGNSDELRCRSGMQAKLVDDGNFARRHVGS
jgi:hypothetical protein